MEVAFQKMIAGSSISLTPDYSIGTGNKSHHFTLFFHSHF